MQNSIETKEVRGLSYKGLVTILISTISVVITLVMTYSQIVNKIDAADKQRDHDKEMINVTIETLKSEITTLKTNNTTLSDRIDDLEKRK